nr:UxaA family hydrolase [Bacillus subtilis]
MTTSVQCVVGVLDYAVKRIKEELLPKYPNVDDVVQLHHQYGCGVAINAPDAVIRSARFKILRSIRTSAEK